MMKRNILAVVIPALLAAGAANAAETYNKDGNKLNLYGKVDARHKFSKDANADGDQTYVLFGFKGETELNDKITGYGQWEYNVQANIAESQATTGSKTRLGLVGLKFGDADSLDYGRNYGIIYDAMSYTGQLPIFGNDTIMIGPSNGLATYRNSNFFGLVEDLSFAAQYQSKNEGHDVLHDNGDGWGSSVAYDTGMGVSVVGAYAFFDRTNLQAADGKGDKSDQWGTGLKYDANNVYLSAFYGETHNTTAYGDTARQTANKTQNFEVVAQYQFDFGLRPSIAYLQSKGKQLDAVGTFKGDDADLVKYIEVGTYYYFNKNMSTYVDYKINLLNDNDYTHSQGVATENVVGVGLQYQF